MSLAMNTTSKAILILLLLLSYLRGDSEAKYYYVSILSPPPSNPAELNRDQPSPSVHFKYQAFPPYPVIVPTLSLQLHGLSINIMTHYSNTFFAIDTILVNTGCAIVAIEKSRSPLPSLSTLSAGDVGCTIVHQSFLLPREDVSATNVYSLSACKYNIFDRARFCRVIVIRSKSTS